MTTVPGRMNTAIDALMDMIRTSPAWQSWCGSNAKAAAAVFDSVAPANNAPFPHAMVDVGPNQERQRDDCELRGFLITGDLWLMVCDRCAITTESQRAFRDHLDGLLSDLETAPNDGRNLMIRRISLVAGPQFVQGQDRNTKYDEIEVKFALEIREWP